MANINKEICVVGFFLILITFYCDITVSCPISDCQCNDISLTCNEYRAKDLPSVSDVGGRITIQFFNCWHNIDVTQIKYENASSLIVDNCAVASLPEQSFSVLVKLEQLTVTGNSIRDVNANAFDGLSRLDKLDLSNNKLKSLPVGVFEPLKALTVLDLSGNDQLLTVDWSTLFAVQSISLTTFLCNRCGLQKVPTGLFKKVPNLRNLELNGNNFTDGSSGSFGGNLFISLSNLSRLSLEANNVQTLDNDAFIELSASLETLRLGDNKISRLEETNIRLLQRLTKLMLHDNLLVTLDKSEIPPSLLKDGVINSLELSGNPWHCDSNLVWLRNIDQSKIADSERMSCLSPTSMKNRLLYKAPVESFQTPTTSPPSSVAVAAVILWTLTVVVVLVIFVRRVHVKRKQRSSPSRYANVAGTGLKVGAGHGV